MAHRVETSVPCWACGGGRVDRPGGCNTPLSRRSFARPVSFILSMRRAQPTPLPAERLATLLLWPSWAVDAHYRAGWLAPPLLVLILDRLRGIKQTFGRLAARTDACRFVQRRSIARLPHTGEKPRLPNLLPQGFAWLIKLEPDAAASASQLQALLADAEMAALLAAAPTPLRRPLRSPCLGAPDQKPLLPSATFVRPRSGR